jgi:hypothetical protein
MFPGGPDVPGDPVKPTSYTAALRLAFSVGSTGIVTPSDVIISEEDDPFGP